jgi:hypothetical protein
MFETNTVKVLEGFKGLGINGYSFSNIIEGGI